MLRILVADDHPVSAMPNERDRNDQCRILYFCVAHDGGSRTHNTKTSMRSREAGWSDGPAVATAVADELIESLLDSNRREISASCMQAE